MLPRFLKPFRPLCSAAILALCTPLFAQEPAPKATPDEAQSTLTRVGDVSPVMSIATIDGQQIDLRGKVVVLDFFATWCGPCMEEMPHVEKELWLPLKDKGLLVLAVGREHSQEEMAAFQQQKGFTFPFAADPKRDIYGKFANQYIPRCVLIGKDGHIAFQSSGYTAEDFAALIKATEAELAK